MIIIAFEGLDKAGKATQSELLRKALVQKGLKVERAEFHDYSSPTGELIAKWLRKEYDVDQLTIELIMAADKQAKQGWFEELEERGTDVLILDRYTGSQMAYALANDVPKTFELSLQRYMRQPDMTIFIDIPPEVSMARKGKHNNGVNDRYESDLKLLKRVRSIYLEHVLIPTRDYAVNGEKSVDHIHDAIMNSREMEFILKFIEQGAKQ